VEGERLTFDLHFFVSSPGLPLDALDITKEAVALPLIIRERDIEYQFNRILLFDRLIKVILVPQLPSTLSDFNSRNFVHRVIHIRKILFIESVYWTFRRSSELKSGVACWGFRGTWSLFMLQSIKKPQLLPTDRWTCACH